MHTTSTPLGRDVQRSGHPMRICELVAQIEGATYVARASLHTPNDIRRAKKAIRRAFETQLHGHGFALVELLSNCPTNWGMTPRDALAWVESHMLPVFPLGDYKVAPALAAIKI